MLWTGCMPSSQPIIRFGDIIHNIESIMSYVEDHDFESFVADRRTVDAVERCLQRITEAAIKLHPEAAELLPEQDWKAMRDLGNKLRHYYDVILDEDIWTIVHERLPNLLKDCRRAISKIKSNKP